MLNIIDESLRSLNEQITNKFEERIKEALRTWGVDPDDIEEVKRRCTIQHCYKDTKELIIDNNLVMIFTDWSMDGLNFDDLETKISVSFKCSEIIKPKEY